MNKIKNIYLIIDGGSTDGLSSISKLTGKNYATGLVLEATDGKFYAQLSTDLIVPFEEVKSAKSLAQLIVDLNKSHPRPPNNRRGLWSSVLSGD